jgi:hypothetical protein
MALIDESRFDAWSRQLASGLHSRRGVMQSLSTGIGLLAFGMVARPAEAKKKKKRKKNKPACGSGETTCPAGYPAPCCPTGTECCQSRIACCSLE